jgi:GTP pyrophosphokinase
MLAIPEIKEAIVHEYYKEFADDCDQYFNQQDRELVHQAFIFAYNAHQGVKRKSGEPYIIHPIKVAQIAIREIGLDAKAISAALLHDVVEDTTYTIEDIKNKFGERIAVLVNGLTKISEVFNTQHSLQAENFRRLIHTLSDDVYVILIKLADRLHNMRTLDSLPKHKQLKIAGESIYLFAPIAYRLGFFSIKRELEDLSIKYRYPEVYEEIKSKIESREKTRKYFINNFVSPLKTRLEEESYAYCINREPRSIYTIWRNMQDMGMSFDEIYDLIIITIVFKPKPDIPEKAQCWNIYSMISDFYMPKPDKIYDYVTKPRANGYESLHATFMGPDGKWVEVRIRSERMQEIAKRGLAASLKYKSEEEESELIKWISKVKELFESSADDPSEFMDEFKMNLFSDEIVIFTPKGHIITLPQDSIVLDFAYEIHTDIGDKAIAAKVNHQLVPLNHKLRNGDQVEILTSGNKSSLNEEWLDEVVTAKAKTKIKKNINNEYKKTNKLGKTHLNKKLEELDIPIDNNLYRKLLYVYNVKSKKELFSKIGEGSIQLDNIKKELKKKRRNKWIRYWELQISRTKNKRKVLKSDLSTKGTIQNQNQIIIDNEKDHQNISYNIANCCKPIPGDEVIGYLASPNQVVIHKSNCSKAVRLMSQKGNQIIEVKWRSNKLLSFLVRINIKGINKTDIYSNITSLLSEQLSINIRSINFDSYDGLFEGNIDLYVHNTKDVNNLIGDILEVKGVESVNRVELEE